MAITIQYSITIVFEKIYEHANVTLINTYKRMFGSSQLWEASITIVFEKMYEHANVTMINTYKRMFG